MLGRPIGAFGNIGTQHSEGPGTDHGFSCQVESSEGSQWLDMYEERAAHRQFSAGCSRAEADRFAWGEIVNRWHLQNGEKVSPDTCAGCWRPIGADAVLDLIDGCRVHNRAGHSCLIQYGRRWRLRATRALVELGLRPPD